MKVWEFEQLLDRAVARLNSRLETKGIFESSKAFENSVRRALEHEGTDFGIEIDFDPHPHIFPDIVIGKFGVEVKFSDKDTWRSVANSIFEGRRDANVEHIYLIFGKMGGDPEVKWASYADSVIHVRTSHVPRFEVEISDKQSLFEQFGISYSDFQKLSIEEKMEHVRHYARERLKEGERLWWLDSGQSDTDHTLPIQARLYMSLTTPEKRQMRAEAALLCPSIVRPSRAKKKYDDAALYLLTYHGVLCTQVRDLFSAGSVAMRSDDTRGGNYVERALLDIEPEMRKAAAELDDEVFLEYWGRSVPVKDRLKEWLKLADKAARGEWKPSESIFRDD